MSLSCHVFCRFAKNLNADKINISTLKGEGELSNLELNEEILMQLLDLPSWLILTKAVCNKINVKIQWTKLKSQPICLVSCLKFKCFCLRCSCLFFLFYLSNLLFMNLIIASDCFSIWTKLKLLWRRVQS